MKTALTKEESMMSLKEIEAFRLGKIQGIKEVVDFVERIEKSEPAAMSWSFRQRWQDKLKSWGLHNVGD